MSNFKVGEKVVCVDPCAELIKGEIYTITFVGFIDNVSVSEAEPDVPYIWFKESRFRKLDYAHTERICAKIIESLKVEEVQLN